MVRVHQPAGQEGHQDEWRRPQRVIEAKGESPSHRLGARPVTRHATRGVVLESPVNGRLGRDAIRHSGVDGVRRSPQAHQNMAPTGGVPRGLGEGVRLAPEGSLGGEDLPGRDALADQDFQPPHWCIPDAPPPPGIPRAPPKKLANPRPLPGRALLAVLPP